jgi:hypothetical protein
MWQLGQYWQMELFFDNRQHQKVGPLELGFHGQASGLEFILPG